METKQVQERASRGSTICACAVAHLTNHLYKLLCLRILPSHLNSRYWFLQKIRFHMTLSMQSDVKRIRNFLHSKMYIGPFEIDETSQKVVQEVNYRRFLSNFHDPTFSTFGCTMHMYDKQMTDPCPNGRGALLWNTRREKGTLKKKIRWIVKWRSMGSFVQQFACNENQHYAP